MKYRLFLLVSLWLTISAAIPFMQVGSNYFEQEKKEVNQTKTSTENSDEEAQIFAKDWIVSMPAASVSMISVFFILFSISLSAHTHAFIKRTSHHDPHFVLMVTKQSIWPGQAP